MRSAPDLSVLSTRQYVSQVEPGPSRHSRGSGRGDLDMRVVSSAVFNVHCPNVTAQKPCVLPDVVASGISAVAAKLFAFVER